MKRVLITGMSGTGKSTVIEELAKLGYTAVDADLPGVSEVVEVPEHQYTGLGPGLDWVWREDRIQEILSSGADPLFISGCSPNQGKFYRQFYRVVLLSAPPSLIVERLAYRTNNSYGKDPEEVVRVLHLKETIEPLLRRSAHVEIDTSAPLADVVARILRLVEET